LRFVGGLLQGDTIGDKLAADELRIVGTTFAEAAAWRTPPSIDTRDRLGLLAWLPLVAR
jgi:hypothetical protein